VKSIQLLKFINNCQLKLSFFPKPAQEDLEVVFRCSTGMVVTPTNTFLGYKLVLSPVGERVAVCCVRGCCSGAGEDVLRLNQAVLGLLLVQRQGGVAALQQICQLRLCYQYGLKNCRLSVTILHPHSAQPQHTHLKEAVRILVPVRAKWYRYLYALPVPVILTAAVPVSLP